MCGEWFFAASWRCYLIENTATVIKLGKLEVFRYSKFTGLWELL